MQLIDTRGLAVGGGCRGGRGQVLVTEKVGGGHPEWGRRCKRSVVGTPREQHLQSDASLFVQVLNREPVHNCRFSIAHLQVKMALSLSAPLQVALSCR